MRYLVPARVLRVRGPGERFIILLWEKIKFRWVKCFGNEWRFWTIYIDADLCVSAQRTTSTATAAMKPRAEESTRESMTEARETVCSFPQNAMKLRLDVIFLVSARWSRTIYVTEIPTRKQTTPSTGRPGGPEELCGGLKSTTCVRCKTYI